MRVVFVNLHSNVFYVKTLSSFLYGTSVATKHRYLLDYLLENDSIKVCNFINDKGFSLAQNLSRRALKFLNLFNGLENSYVMRKNGLKGKNIQVIKNVNEIRDNDVVIAYIHSLGSLSQLDQINTKAKKIVCVIHLFGTKEESEILKEVTPDTLFNEYNLKERSSIFQQNFSWYQSDFIIHPFAFASRFKSVIPFNERENLAFSVGTITYEKKEEYKDFYGSYCLQPSRKQILDNKDVLKDYINCYNFEYMEDFKPINISKKVPRIFRIPFEIYNISHSGRQKKYFSFDMVEMFNKHKMFICGEEVSGCPAIGFVEGMACGCAYIGNKTIGCYEDYGMIEGVHYIGYDGTLENLKEVISYYQAAEHFEELEKIANEGMNFAREHFNQRAVAKDLWDKLLN